MFSLYRLDLKGIAEAGFDRGVNIKYPPNKRERERI
jgi:hypothetical protein